MNDFLQGIRVLDMSQHVAGPYCGLLLADAGAEVIRIEPIGGADDRHFGYLSPTKDSYTFASRNRGKKSVTLNLKTEKGREMFHRLVKLSDVVVESFAVRAKERMGVNYDSLGKVNQGIIIASISAFGKTGPYANKTAFDPIVQAMSGSMACTGFPGTVPTRSAVAWADFGAGLHAAFGVMLALMQRSKTGLGQEIDSSLFDSAISLMALYGVYAEYHALGVERPQLGNASPYAFADTFSAKDGLVFISATRDAVWQRFLKVLDREDLSDDPRFSSDWERAKNRKIIADMVAPWVASRNCADVLRILEDGQVPCGKVTGIGETADDAHVRARDMLFEKEYPEAGKVLVAGPVLKFSGTPAHDSERAPLVGEHNAEIYGQLLDYTPEELEEIKKTGVI